jgi:hypothetical protein
MPELHEAIQPEDRHECGSQYLSENALALVPEGGQRPRDGGLERIFG